MKSKQKNYSSLLLTQEYLINDQFVDNNLVKNYQQEFDLIFNVVFGEFPDLSFKYYSRYRCGMIVYHSVIYNRRKNSDSYSVCIEDRLNSKTRISFGQTLFFFYVNQKPYAFLKRYSSTKKLFSSLINPFEHVKNWTQYIDRFYPIVRYSTSEYVIIPCDCIVCKCICIPLDNDFQVCAPVELELEHD